MVPNGPTSAGRAFPRELWPARARVWVNVLLAVVAVGTLVVLVGWYSHSGELIRLGLQSVPMRINSAVMLLALAVAHVVPRRVRLAIVAVVVAVGVVTILEYRVGFDAHIDQLLGHDWAGQAPFAFKAPGRPSEASAASFVLLAASALLNDFGRRTAAQVCAVVPLAFGTLAIYGYLYGTESLYQIGPYSIVAVHTACAVALLAVAALLSVPAGVLQWISFGEDPGAALQRRLVLVAALLVPAVGWVIQEGESVSSYDSGTKVALLVAFVAFLIVFVGYRVGRMAFRLDRERDILLTELHEVNAALEDRVRSRSHQLNRQRTKLALFEERDRIARDLHDRVIQRIFAAGLQVASLGRTARKDAQRHGEDGSPIAESLDTVATELDLAIRELRNSIFELTSVGDLDNIEQVVRDIAARASRILGFMPRVDVSGPTAGMPAELVAQIASVMQEGLSNVARHAHAHAAEVALEASDTELRVRITDDGIGLPDPLPRSSGINNVINRARRLGGSATWSANLPTGTVLLWRVPRDSTDGEAQGNGTPVVFSDSDQSAAASLGS